MGSDTDPHTDRQINSQTKVILMSEIIRQRTVSERHSGKESRQVNIHTLRITDPKAQRESPVPEQMPESMAVSQSFSQ